MRAAIDVRGAFHRLFSWKVRGIRWIDILGFVLVAAMIFSVYLAKAGAAGESAHIADLEGQIETSAERVRLLRAEVARLEQPARLDALSKGAGLGPVDVHRRGRQGELGELVGGQTPAPVVVATPEPTPDEAVDPNAPAPVAAPVAPPAAVTPR